MRVTNMMMTTMMTTGLSTTCLLMPALLIDFHVTNVSSSHREINFDADNRFEEPYSTDEGNVCCRDGI